MTYCQHNVTEGYCLECLRAEVERLTRERGIDRDAFLDDIAARAEALDAALARVGEAERERDASHELIMRLTEKLEKATSALLAAKVREDDLRATLRKIEVHTRWREDLHPNDKKAMRYALDLVQGRARAALTPPSEKERALSPPPAHAKGCACTHEAGDSPCPVHGMEEER